MYIIYWNVMELSELIIKAYKNRYTFLLNSEEVLSKLYWW